ncbi:hypothetical protein IMSAGC006_02072 [Muribaculaceae bacterium]|jgi:membrane protein implicated in regulation of membrane protease activity|nr:NfeD family protein [Muribaculaceae bacterium]GFI07316.1 hypothetical protein IMSAGC006_02072 [Muribaculaceae bacterium]
MEPWIIWIIAAAALLIIEILSQMVWTLCLSAGSLAGMTAALAGADPLWQAVAMAVTAVATYIVIIPWYRRWHESVIARSGHQSRTGMDALLGRRATVTQEIKPGELGRARIDGDNWQVRAPGIHTTITRGEEVIVNSYDSIILNVSRPTPNS